MIESTAELYVHAMAMEREAAARYTELARRMTEKGDVPAATLFARLAADERENLAALRRRTAGVALPPLECDYSWPAVAPGRISAHSALGLALKAERRARAFFEQAQRVARDPGMRSLAREMAAGEAEHIAMIEAQIARTPDAVVDWAAVFDAR